MQSAAAKEIVAQDPTVPIKSGAVAGNPLVTFYIHFFIAVY